jgi:hypothetical protein
LGNAERSVEFKADADADASADAEPSAPLEA